MNSGTEFGSAIEKSGTSSEIMSLLPISSPVDSADVPEISELPAGARV